MKLEILRTKIVVKVWNMVSENCKFESERVLVHDVVKKTTNPICKLHDILLTESFFISVVSRVQEQIGQFMRIMLET